MKKIKQMFSLVLAFVMVCMLLPFNAFAAEKSLASESGVKRDIVLMLDISDSMEGTPFTTMKEAAMKFCQNLLGAEGDNRIALVVWDASYKTYPFNSDINAVEQTIENIQIGGGTNTANALAAAKDLMASSAREDALKNIILLTDGIPQHGDGTSDGPYTSSDSSYYRYANSAYNIATEIMEQYNLYTLGFFHNLTGKDLEFGQRFLKDIQNSGYYEVVDPDDLEFTFGEVVDDITQEQLKKLYTEEHIAYYNGNFKKEIQEIGLPGDNNRQNTNYILGNVVLDAAEDNVSRNYNAASIITDVLNKNFEFVDGAVSNYELILADIVTSSYYKDVLEEAYSISFSDNAIQWLKDIVDYGFDNIDEMAKAANTSADALRQEWQSLAQILDQMKVTDNPDEFAELFGKCSVVVDKYMKADNQRKFLNSMNGKKGYKGDVLGAVLDATLDTMSEMITYYSCYDAYCEASDTFKEILVLIDYHASSRIQTGADGNPIYTGGLDEVFYSTSLSIAIEHFLDNASEEATGAGQIAKRFAKEEIENLGSAFAEAGVEILLDQIPIVKELNHIREIAGLTAAGAMFIVDCATKIDDRAFAASMIYHLYFLANYAASAASDCGGALVSREDSDEAFEWAYRFDEAVRIWRCCSIMMCDLGMEFEAYCLREAQDNLFWNHNIFTYNKYVQKASWHSTAISMASLEKTLISDIHCHSTNLSYDPSSGVINLGPNAQVITIACPVSVSVTNERGQQIAFLTDETQTIATGYEPYFHVLETERGSNDYMKICYIPDTWNVTFIGTGNGTMHVLKANIVEGNIQNPIVSPEISISKGTKGHISNDNNENVVVLDPIGTKTITFDANGGKLTGDSKMLTGNDGKLSSLPANPTHDGEYAFNGWYTEAVGGTRITTDHVFRADATIYAQWTYIGSSGEGNNSSEDSSNSDIPGNISDGDMPGDKENSNTPSTSSDSIDKIPDTGDTADIQRWGVLLLTATVVVTITFGFKNKKRMKSEK